MNDLQKEVASILLSDTQGERAFCNEVLPAIAETLANYLDVGMNESYAIITGYCLDYLIHAKEDNADVVEFRKQILKDLSAKLGSSKE